MAQHGMLAVKTVNLTKIANTYTLVDSVNISVMSGGVYALLGPNGAGKTTLMKLLVGLIKPTAGNIEFFQNVQHSIGILIENSCPL